MLEKKGEPGQKKTDPGRGRETQGIFFKEDSHKGRGHRSWGQTKGLGRSVRFVQLETRRHFSATPSGKATWPEPRNTFRKTNVKGRDQAPPAPPRPQAAPPGRTQWPCAQQTDGRTAARNHSGNIPSRCRWANRRIFLSLENILETPTEETRFSCWLTGLKRDSCLPGSRRTQGPRTGQPSRGWLPPGSAVQVRGGARSDGPHPED